MPLRKFTALSARTVACFLASEDDPEKALCPHEPTIPPIQALTKNGTHHSHLKREARSVARTEAQPNNGTLEAGTMPSAVTAERAAKDGEASARSTDQRESLVSNRPRSDGAHCHDSRDDEKTKEASVEKGREKDPKSFTQNLFDTFAIRMLEWLPVPNLMSVPDVTLAGEDSRESSKNARIDENQTTMKASEHSDKVESQDLGNPDTGDSKLKPRSPSVTTRLRLNSASTLNHTNPPGVRKTSKSRALGANEEPKQGSQQYPQPETLRQRQGLREQGARRRSQSELPSQAERKNEGFNSQVGILNEECTTASGSPESAMAWGQLKAWITQNQEDTSVSCTDKLKSCESSQISSEADRPQVDTMKKPPGLPSVENPDADPTLVLGLPTEQSIASKYASVYLHPRNGYAPCGSTYPITSTNKMPPTETLRSSHSSGSSIVGLPPDTPLKHRTNPKEASTLLPDIDHSTSGRTVSSFKKTAGRSTVRLPQSLSHLSVDIVEGLLDIVKPPSKSAEDPLLFYKLSGFRVGQASKTSILRQHRRALQFGAQSLFYVMSTPEALLRSFRTRLDDASQPSGEDDHIKSDHPTQIDQAIRSLNVFNESKVIFRSLWIALGALFTPPPDLSHPKTPRMKAAISLSKTRSSSSSGEHAAVSSSTDNVYYPDREAVHILKLSLSALVAAVPRASAQTMLAIRTLRASGRVAPDANPLATNAELVRSLLKVTDVLEDELALSLMCRLVQAIAARCCAAEIIKNKQARNYSRTSQGIRSQDVLGLLLEYLREAQSETSSSGAAKSITAGRGTPIITAGSNKVWSMSAVTVEWLRSVLLKKWDGRAKVARWGVVGGAVMILASLCKSHADHIRHLSTTDTLTDAHHEELGLSPETFHTPFLSERLDPMDMPVEWLADTASSKSLHLLSYSFLFPPSALVTYFRALNFASMSKAYEAAMTTSRLVLHLAFAGDQNDGRLCTRLKTAMSTNLVIEVRRDNVLRDALNQLWRRERRELMRPLKVRMGMDEGEEGVDHGGVQQEFFRMAIGEALNPDYGMAFPPKNSSDRHLSLSVDRLVHN